MEQHAAAPDPGNVIDLNAYRLRANAHLMVGHDD